LILNGLFKLDIDDVNGMTHPKKNIGAIISDPVFYNKSERNNFEFTTCILWLFKKKGGI